MSLQSVIENNDFNSGLVPGMEYIYILKCPVTNQIRYVGRTSNPHQRYREHCDCKGYPGERIDWIRQLATVGKFPVLAIVDTCDRRAGAIIEGAWIAHFAGTGIPIFNLVPKESAGAYDALPAIENLIDAPITDDFARSKRIDAARREAATVVADKSDKLNLDTAMIQAVNPVPAETPQAA